MEHTEHHEQPEPFSAAELAAVRRSMTNGRLAMTRRSLLRAGGALAAVTGGLGALAGCGIPPAGRTDANDSQDHSAAEKRINFSNWTEYMDVDESEKHHPTLDAFTERTGIKVKYTEDINDNNEFFGKIKPQLAAGQDTGRDLMVLTDWMSARIIRQGWAQRLDPARLGNAVLNIEDRYRMAAHDPGRQYTYPWAGTACVVAYNKKATKGKKVTSVRQLLEDEDLKGRVSMLTEMTDTMGMALLDQGTDCGKFTDRDFDRALARIQRAVDDKQLRRFTGNDYGDELDSGDVAACLAWAGDIVQLQLDNPDIEFAIPDSGYLTSTDDMIIPARARHQANAEALINYYYQPRVAAELAAGINYICPVAGAQAEMRKIDKKLAANPLIFPDARSSRLGHSFKPMTADQQSAYENKFSRLIGA
jgi:spermidine/putrescine transport system substrate-binding protein